MQVIEGLAAPTKSASVSEDQRWFACHRLFPLTRGQLVVIAYPRSPDRPRVSLLEVERITPSECFDSVIGEFGV